MINFSESILSLDVSSVFKKLNESQRTRRFEICGIQLDDVRTLLSHSADEVNGKLLISRSCDILISVIPRMRKGIDYQSQEVLEVVLALINLLYKYQVLSSKKFLAERIQVKFVHKLISIGLFETALENAQHVLNQLRCFSNKTIEADFVSPESSEFQSFVALAVSCWLCILLAATELDDASGALLSAVSMISGQMQTILFWIGMSTNPEQNHALVFRYALRIVERISYKCANLQRPDARVTSMATLALVACTKSDSFQQMPYLICTLSHKLEYSEFADSFLNAKSAISRSVEQNSWLMVFERIASDASKYNNHRHAVRIIYFIAETAGINLDLLACKQVMLLRLSITGLCDSDNEMNLLRCIETSRASFQLVLTHGPGQSEISWICRALDEFSVKISQYLREHVIPALASANFHLIGLLMKNVLLFLDVMCMLNFTSGSESVTPLLQKSALHLTLAQIMLTYASFTSECEDFMESQEAVLLAMFASSFNLLQECDADKVRLCLEQTACRALDTCPNAALFLMKCCTFDASVAQGDVDRLNFDKLSSHLVAFSDACVKNGKLDVAFHGCIAGVLQSNTSPKARYMFHFELIRCWCMSSEAEMFSFCHSGLSCVRDGIFSPLLIKELLAEHLTVWQETVSLDSFKGSEQLIVESRLAFTLCITLELSQSFGSADADLIAELLDSLLFLLRRQCTRHQRDCVSFTLMQRLFAIIRVMLSQTDSLEYCPIHTARTLEIGIRIMLLLTGNVSDDGQCELEDCTQRILSQIEIQFFRSFKCFSQDMSAVDEAFAKQSWMNVVIALEAFYHKLNLLDRFRMATSISGSIMAITGIALQVPSPASKIMLFPVANISQVQKLPDTTGSRSGWKRSACKLELSFENEIHDICAGVMHGKLLDAFVRVTKLLEEFELLIKCFQSSAFKLISTNIDKEELLALPRIQSSVHYEALTVIYAMDFWQIIGLYFEAAALKANILYLLGHFKLSNSIFHEMICICNSMNLPLLALVINVKRATHFIDHSLIIDADKVISAVEASMHVCKRDSLAQHFEEALNVSVLAMRSDLLGKCGKFLCAEKAFNSFMTAALRMMDMCSSRCLNQNEFSTWYLWCCFAISNAGAQHALYVDIDSAELLLLQSKKWMQVADVYSAFDSAGLYLAQSTLNIRKLLRDLESTDCCSQKLLNMRDQTIEMIVAALNAWDSSPQFVKKSACLYGALMTMSIDVSNQNYRGVIIAIYTLCGASFRQRELVNILMSQFRLAVEDATTKKALLETVEANTAALVSIPLGVELKTNILARRVYIPEKIPIVTISESCVSSLFYRCRQGVERQLLLTRCSAICEEVPIVIKLPWFQVKTGVFGSVNFLDAFAEILTHVECCSTDGMLNRTQRMVWWEERILRDRQLHECLKELQRQVLGCWWFLLCGEPDLLVIQESIKASVSIMRHLQDISDKVGVELHAFSAHLLRLLIQHVDELTLDEIKCVLLGTFVVDAKPESKSKHRGGCSFSVKIYSDIETLAKRCKELSLSFLRPHTACTIPSDSADVSTTGSVYLLLDNEIAHLPWEAVPKLIEQKFFRIPCVLSLASQDKKVHNEQSSDSQRLFDLANTSVVLNPSGDLTSTEEKFTPFALKNTEWSVTTAIPSAVTLANMLQESDLFLYFGHGTGRQYLLHPTVLRHAWRSGMVLMGCSSGAIIRLEGDLEPDGDILTYLLAGSPCILANLWDVTDKDIDRFSASLIDSWTQGCSTSMQQEFASALNARNSCRLRWLTGSAPVFYGTPIFLKDSRVNLIIATTLSGAE